MGFELDFKVLFQGGNTTQGIYTINLYSYKLEPTGISQSSGLCRNQPSMLLYGIPTLLRKVRSPFHN
jgi:hypothetical protein